VQSAAAAALSVRGEMVGFTDTSALFLAEPLWTGMRRAARNDVVFKTPTAPHNHSEPYCGKTAGGKEPAVGSHAARDSGLPIELGLGSSDPQSPTAAPPPRTRPHVDCFLSRLSCSSRNLDCIYTEEWKPGQVRVGSSLHSQ